VHFVVKLAAQVKPQSARRLHRAAQSLPYLLFVLYSNSWLFNLTPSALNLMAAPAQVCPNTQQLNLRCFLTILRVLYKLIKRANANQFFRLSIPSKKNLQIQNMFLHL
jgi:hypothetical protein